MADISTPPVLSTPATHIFEAEPERPSWPSTRSNQRLSEEQLYLTYEIDRTFAEIRKERWTRVALQFPDNMLPDAPRVFEALSRNLDPASLDLREKRRSTTNSDLGSNGLDRLGISSELPQRVRLYILADTSYGACCVDEIAAEHVNADAVVHYGQACLSPTARIPVLHIFTIQPLPDKSRLIEDFQSLYENRGPKIILMADVTHQVHLQSIMALLQSQGYYNLYLTEIVHDPSSPLPNRSVPDEVKADPSNLKKWQLFHISNPPESLLLTLSSRLENIHIYSTVNTGSDESHKPFLASTSRALSRRYALLTSISIVSVFGILINTLSVKNYLHIVEHVKSQILAAGKKSYTFVVGKVNAAKVANFSEIGAWVVIGCWESSLIDSKDFWKPVLTPFELELALRGDGERVWTGEWSSDFQKILDEPKVASTKHTAPTKTNGNETSEREDGLEDGELDSEPESAPPEFDLRTGRYVSHSRPMQAPSIAAKGFAVRKNSPNNSLIMRAKGDLAVVGGEVSPGAEHLRSKRTWKGLGSDFEIAYEEPGTAVEEGRSGIARGYVHGSGDVKT
ncbi:Diphthamide biosynthesis protein 2 [Mycoblastus sanguinarius]|nr:Diphthamide biosynthesis protein 2 [Mycoblastus sanguinarius]